MYLVQTVAPANEPLSLEDAKSFMRILESDDDTTIEAMIKSAREYAENYTNRQFEVATYELFTDKFVQDLKLPKNPIKDLTKIEYMDENGDYQILDSSYYYLYGENDIFKVHFDTTVAHKTHKNAIKFTFDSGYDVVPESIVSYIRLDVSTLNEERVLLTDFKKNKEVYEMFIKMLDMYRVQPI